MDEMMRGIKCSGSFLGGLPLKNTVLIFLAWLIFIFVWFVFVSSSISIYKHAGVFLLSFLVLLCIIGILWLHWLKKMMPWIDWRFLKTLGIINHIVLIVVIPCSIIVLTSVFLLFFADTFSLLQNVSIFFMSIVCIFLSISILWKISMKSVFHFDNRSKPFSSFCQNDDPWR